MKLKEEIEKYNKNKSKNIFDEIIAKDYETLLRKEEAEIRQHICVEHQFKLHSEYLEQKIMEFEEDNIMLSKKLVSKLYHEIIILYIGKTKKKI